MLEPSARWHFRSPFGTRHPHTPCRVPILIRPVCLTSQSPCISEKRSRLRARCADGLASWFSDRASDIAIRGFLAELPCTWEFFWRRSWILLPKGEAVLVRPSETQAEGSEDLFRSWFDQVLDRRHELVWLVDATDWEWTDVVAARSWRLLLLKCPSCWPTRRCVRYV